MNIKSALLYELKSPIAGFPKHVKLELTNNCNISCAFCPNKEQTRPKGYMPFGLFKKAVDQCVGKAEVISLHFMGESLLHKKINECIDYVKGTGLKAILSTNATFLENLSSVPSITIINYFEKNKFVKKFAEKADRENALYVFQKVGETREKHDWGRSGKIFNEKHCFDLWRKMVVLWDGRIVPCCFYWDAEVVVGDLNKQSVMEAWNSKEMQDFRKNHMMGEIKKCIYCKKTTNWRAALASEWKKETNYFKVRGGQF